MSPDCRRSLYATTEPLPKTDSNTARHLSIRSTKHSLAENLMPCSLLHLVVVAMQREYHQTNRYHSCEENSMATFVYWGDEQDSIKDWRGATWQNSKWMNSVDCERRAYSQGGRSTLAQEVSQGSHLQQHIPLQTRKFSATAHPELREITGKRGVRHRWDFNTVIKGKTQVN